MNDRPSRGPLLTLTLSAKPSFRRVLSNRPFSLLWAGPLVSQSGDFIFDVAAIWYVLQLTGDPFKVGLAVATILLPANFIGPIAGVYLDRFNRRDVMLASNLVQAKVPGDMLGRVFTSLVALLTIASPDFVCPSGRFGNFNLDRRDVRDLRRTDRPSLHSGISILPRLARRELLILLVAEMGLDLRLDLMLRHRSNDAVDRFTVAEDKESRDALHLKLARSERIFIH